MNKVKAINNMITPTSKRNIQVFLGMVGYYYWFIPNFAFLVNPFFYLLKEDTMFIWTDNCQDVFDSLWNFLIAVPVLAYPDFSKKFIVQTDANLTAVIGVL